MTCAKCGAQVLGRRKGLPLKYCSKGCRYSVHTGRRPLPEEERCARQKASRNASRARHRDAQNARRREWSKNNREVLSARNRAAKFGLSSVDVARILASQGGGCAVCTAPLVLLGTKGAPDLAHVDHDHGSGVVRGVLCRSCNLAIGHMKDSPDRLRRAAAYLAERGAR